jgi:hypothetical protein
MNIKDPAVKASNRFTAWVSKYRVWLLMTPLYLTAGLFGYWGIFDRDTPVNVIAVDYEPTSFFETETDRSISVTYTMIRNKSCVVSTERYMVSIERPNDVYFIETLPPRDVSDRIGEKMKITFTVNVPDRLPPGDYNYYAVSSYACSKNPLQLIVPLTVESPRLPVTIKPVPRFD